MGGCYTQDSPFPQVSRSSRPFPPRSSKPPSNCLPVCLLKQVEPTPHFFFCSSGSCDAYSPFLRSRCCCCCFINSIFFFFNSSASSYPYSPSSASEAPPFSASSSFSSSSSTPLLLLILTLALLLPMLLLLQLHQLHQSATSKTDLRQKLSRNCSIFRLLLFLFFVLLQLLCFFRCLLFSFSCSRRRRCCCFFINSHQSATSNNGFAAPKKDTLSQNCFIFPLFLFFLLFLFNPSASSDTYYSLSPAPDAPTSATSSIQQLHRRILLQTNSTRELAAKNASRAEDSDTRSYGSLVGSRLYPVGLI